MLIRSFLYAVSRDNMHSLVMSVFQIHVFEVSDRRVLFVIEEYDRNSSGCSWILFDSCVLMSGYDLP